MPSQRRNPLKLFCESKMNK